jgi:hypothetical protein
MSNVKSRSSNEIQSSNDKEKRGRIEWWTLEYWFKKTLLESLTSFHYSRIIFYFGHFVISLTFEL